MKWLTDLLSALFGSRFPATEAPASLPSDEAVDFPFTHAEMRDIVRAAGCGLDRVDVVAIAFTKAFIRFGVSNSLPIAHILAHCAHESGGFTYVRENLNYSSAARIRDVFRNNRGIAALTDSDLLGLVNNPVALANIVYADSNRREGYKLGNWMADDGWNFRGWGWAQLTGRSAMEAFAKYMGLRLSDVMERTDAEIFALSALWFALVEKKGFLPAAMDDDILKTTVIWNGGTNGLDDRRARLARIKLAMGVHAQ